MKKRIAIAAALLVVVAGVGVAAAAHFRRHNPEDIAARIVERATKEFSLDAAQKQGLDKLVADILPVARQLRTVREETRTKLGNQLKAGMIDVEQLKSATHTNLASLEQSADRFIEGLATLYAQLTPAQKAKVAERFEKLDDWREHDGRGGHGQHGHPRDNR